MRTGRKRAGWALALLLCALPAFGGDERVSLRVAYGAARIYPYDINEYLGDFVRWRRDIGYTFPDAGLKTLDWTDGLEATLSVPLGAHVAAFVAIGRIGTARNGNDIDAGVYQGTISYKRNDAVRSTVGRVGLSYAAALSGGLALRPHVSLDGYWTSFHDDGAEISTYNGQGSNNDIVWSADSTAFNVGWTVGATFDVALGAGLSVSLDAGWRHARTSGFVGTYREIDYGAPATTGDFRLFTYHDYVDWIPATYRQLSLPGSYAEGVVRGLRDAAIDLSGVYASAGLRLSF